MIEKSATDLTREAEFVAFRAGGLEFCINIMSVREIRGWTPATAIPRAPFSRHATMRASSVERRPSGVPALSRAWATAPTTREPKILAGYR